MEETTCDLYKLIQRLSDANSQKYTYLTMNSTTFTRIVGMGIHTKYWITIDDSCGNGEVRMS